MDKESKENMVKKEEKSSKDNIPQKYPRPINGLSKEAIERIIKEQYGYTKSD